MYIHWSLSLRLVIAQIDPFSPKSWNMIVYIFVASADIFGEDDTESINYIVPRFQGKVDRLNGMDQEDLMVVGLDKATI